MRNVNNQITVWQKGKINQYAISKVKTLKGYQQNESSISNVKLICNQVWSNLHIQTSSNNLR